MANNNFINCGNYKENFVYKNEISNNINDNSLINIYTNININFNQFNNNYQIIRNSFNNHDLFKYNNFINVKNINNY